LVNGRAAKRAHRDDVGDRRAARHALRSTDPVLGAAQTKAEANREARQITRVDQEDVR